MKKLLIILLVTVISLGASAQRRYAGHRSYRRSHVVVVSRPVYPSYHYGYYDPFYYSSYPYSRYEYFPMETKLDVKIAGIRNDYQDKIWSARHNKSLSKAKRKEIIHRLKSQREEAVNRAKADYYKSS